MTYPILIAEDDADIANILKLYLEGGRYRDLTASDGETAYRLIETEEVHLAIFDVMMPKMDGFTLRIMRPTFPPAAMSVFPPCSSWANGGSSPSWTARERPFTTQASCQSTCRRTRWRSSRTHSLRTAYPHRSCVQPAASSITGSPFSMTRAKKRASISSTRAFIRFISQPIC